MGGDLNGFQDIMHFMKRVDGACPRGSMSLNAVCHKEQQYYIWYMGGDLKFPRYNTFYEMMGVGHAPQGPLWDPWSM